VKNVTYLVAAVALLSILALSAMVPASSAASAIVITDSDLTNPPGVGLPGTSFTFNLAAAEPSTVLGMIFGGVVPVTVTDPASTTWALLDGAGAPVVIVMPDVGDAVDITFPAASITVVTDPDGDVTVLGPGPYVWAGPVPPSTAVMGLYALSVAGSETMVLLPFMVLDTFLVVPESPLGTIAMLFSGLAGIAGILGIRRYKLSP